MGTVKRVLVLNCGSSTLKWTLLRSTDESTLAEGLVSWTAAREAERAERIRDVLREVPEFDVVGHRIVHGGSLYRETVVVEAQARAGLESLVELDPLHMRPALECVDAVRTQFPSVPQYAAFDTAFHATLPPATGYALPHEWMERWDLRRFGFHGLSVAYSAQRARELTGGAVPRLIVCHLGSGCSVSAVADGRSIDTTMGFTPLEGLMMGTRSGSVDPGLLLYLQLQRGVTPAEMLDALTTRSGLLGVSGVSADLREVLKAADAGNQRAALAYERFVLGVKRAVGAMASVLGGLDALVFTGGIGENSDRVRREVTAAFSFAGAGLDDGRNRSAVPDVDIAGDGSSVRILVIRAREDRMILREVLRHSVAKTRAAGAA
jgi:acetate kinase